MSRDIVASQRERANVSDGGALHMKNSMNDTTESNKPPGQEATATSSRHDSSPSIIPRLVAGSIGSIVTALAVTPLEVVKVRQQLGAQSITSSLPKNVAPCPKGCGTFVLNNGIMDCVLPRSAVAFFDPQGHYRGCGLANKNAPKRAISLGTFGSVRRIFLQEGLSGIYAGLAPTLVMSVPNTVLYFTSYDEIVSRLRRRLDSNAAWIPLVSGATARLVASTATAPLELIRTRQASMIGESKSAPGLLGEFRTICRTEGASALFTGLAPTLWRDVPFSAIYWACLEQFKFMWEQRDGDGPKSSSTVAVQSFINGAAAGAIASAFTTPMDVVKTRRQTVELVTNNTAKAEAVICHHNGFAVYKPPETCVRTQVSTMSVMKNIVDTEGVSGLWRGNQTRMIKVAPACAIMISCYELGKRMME